MSRSLPLDREAALKAIADGWGREATAAHPLCRCGKPYQPTCSLCLAKPNQPCRPQYGDPLVLSDLGRAHAHYRAAIRPGTAHDCPMHRPRRSA